MRPQDVLREDSAQNTVRSLRRCRGDAPQPRSLHQRPPGGCSKRPHARRAQRPVQRRSALRPRPERPSVPRHPKGGISSLPPHPQWRNRPPPGRSSAQRPGERSEACTRYTGRKPAPGRGSSGAGAGSPAAWARHMSMRRQIATNAADAAGSTSTARTGQRAQTMPTSPSLVRPPATHRLDRAATARPPGMPRAATRPAAGKTERRPAGGRCAAQRIFQPRRMQARRAWHDTRHMARYARCRTHDTRHETRDATRDVRHTTHDTCQATHFAQHTTDDT